MKNFFSFALAASFLFLVAFPANAQKKLKEGVVTFELTKLEPESPEAAMLMGTVINFHFDKKQMKMDFSVMGGMMEMGTITSFDKSKGMILMNMMGKKVKVNMREEDLKKRDAQKLPEFDIVYDKKDTKEIAGYKCHKATLKNKETEDVVTMYVTDALKVNNMNAFDGLFKQLNGLPLEFQISQQGMQMTLSATAVKKEVDASVFVAPDGYEEMTMEEFEKQMGGMGAMGGMGF